MPPVHPLPINLAMLGYDKGGSLVLSRRINSASSAVISFIPLIRPRSVELDGDDDDDDDDGDDDESSDEDEVTTLETETC
jgi:hypothetical protein